MIAADCAYAAMGQGKTMNEQMEQMQGQFEKMARSHKDLYTTPTEEMKSELDFKILELEWEGEFIVAPEVVEASQPYIPILVLTRSNSLREWEVDSGKNGFIIASDPEHGEMWIRSLKKRPIKRLKPIPEDKGRKPESEEGYVAGSDWHLVGESRPDPLSQGEYSVALITYDHLSNQRKIKKLGTPKPIDPAFAGEQWPWDRWADIKSFTANPASPALVGKEEFAVTVSGAKADRKIAGTLAGKARPVHLIPPDPKRAAYAGIQAGVHVDLLLFTVDHPPKVVRIDVPILAATPLHAGDSIKGWFNLPFPFEPSIEDRMLYAVVDGSITGPIRVVGEKP
jgi:hypothetical protein